MVPLALAFRVSGFAHESFQELLTYVCWGRFTRMYAMKDDDHDY